MIMQVVRQNRSPQSLHNLHNLRAVSRVQSYLLGFISPSSWINFSTHVHPSPVDRMSQLMQRHDLLCFPTKADNIQIISSPAQFYQKLQELTKGSQERISWSSLYLGTGFKEQRLIQTLSIQLDTCPDLKVNLLFDYHRGTRTDRSGASSIKTLAPLIHRHGPKVSSTEMTAVDDSVAKPKTRDVNANVNLFRMIPKSSPAWDTFFRTLGGRWLELMGLHHMKAYVFDDKIIISGANLSDHYFTQREDRYMVIEHPELAQFFHQFIALMSTSPFAYTAATQSTYSSTSKTGSRKKRVNSQGNCLILKVNEKDAECSKMRQEFADEMQSMFTSLNITSITDHDDTWIFPSLQMGSFGITQDEDLLANLFSLAHDGNIGLDLASGYLNLTDRFSDILVYGSETSSSGAELERNVSTDVANCQINIVAASPQASGFYQAKWPASLVPPGYSVFMKMLLDKVESRNQWLQNRMSDVKLWEWRRFGWSFHAKGLWISSPDADTHISVDATYEGLENMGQKPLACRLNERLPYVTIIGSPNFGPRSVSRDTECTLIILTRNEDLRNRLAQERDRLFKYSTVVKSSDFRTSLFSPSKASILKAEAVEERSNQNYSIKEIELARTLGLFIHWLARTVRSFM